MKELSAAVFALDELTYGVNSDIIPPTNNIMK